MFTRATREQAKLRLALQGPAGSGKTYTALKVAQVFGTRIAVIDTEHESASKYAEDVASFDACPLEKHSPEAYVEAIEFAGQAGYDVLIIDSLSHEWAWCLSEVDRVASAKYRGNSYAAWGDITPRHDKLKEAILASPCHVIATMRSKTAYVLEEGKNGKSAPVKVGMAAVQREGLDYEFDVVGEMTLEHILLVTKTRCSAIADATFVKPGEDFAEPIAKWLSTGVALDTADDLVDACAAVIDDEGLTEARGRVGKAWRRLSRADRERVSVAGNVAAERIAPDPEPLADNMDPDPSGEQEERQAANG